MTQTYCNFTSLGLLFVGPDGGADEKSNPSNQMGLCTVGSIASVRDRLIALIEDLRKEMPLVRVPAISDVSTSDEWDMESIVGSLWDRRFGDN